MASVGKSRTSERGVTKYPVKRLEISIKNFIKVLSIALERLQKHSNNIKRLTATEDWQELHKEQINATSTVQQITANIKEIEKVRSQVIHEDQETFDSRVSEVKAKAVVAVEEFLELTGGEMAPEHSGNHQSLDDSIEFGTGDLESITSKRQSSLPTSSFPSPLPQIIATTTATATTTAPTTTRTASTNSRSASQSLSAAHHSTLESNGDTLEDGMFNDTPDSLAPLLTSNLHAIPQHSEASAWEHLRENVEDLNELVHVFAENVELQAEPVNCIEDNVESSHDEVIQGTTFLARASKYKSAMFPAAGAKVGGVIGGSIGFIAGMKLGGVTAVAGGAVGYAGGKYIKKRQDKIVEVEMTKMSYNMPVQNLKKEENLPETKKASDQPEEKSFVSTVKSWFRFEE